MVEIIRKGSLPDPSEVPPRLRAAAMAATSINVAEPRPAGFPLLFGADFELIEPAVAYLHEHAIQRAHTTETVRTYLEILYEWFDSLEQSGISWKAAAATDLIAYRNRMLSAPSAHTGRSYSARTINHRVQGVLRFYEWMIQNGWLETSDMILPTRDLAVIPVGRTMRRRSDAPTDRRLFLLREFEGLPRPLTRHQARELLARLPTPYDLMARWQLYTGLRVSELLRLRIEDIRKRHSDDPEGHPLHNTIEIIRKGRKRGYVIAPSSLIEETRIYCHLQRRAWLRRASGRQRTSSMPTLFVGSRGSACKKNTYQGIIRRVGHECGFRATSHLFRATYACMMLARLEQLAKQGATINPLLVVKTLMGHVLCLFRAVTNTVMACKSWSGFQQNWAVKCTCSVAGTE